jgi:putative peptidoglycan lipid II flippase
VSGDEDVESPDVVIPPPRRRSESGRVARAAALVGAATLASRILGFTRDAVVARAFGAGPLTDAFFVAFRLPNLFRRLLAEGALSSSFVPVFTEYEATRSSTDRKAMLRAVAGATILVLAAVTVLGVVAAPILVRIMAPGFFVDAGTGHMAVTLARYMFPYLFFVGLAALAMGILNARRRFLAPALSPLALNVAIIAATLFLAPRLEQPVLALAVGVVAGGLGQVLMQVPAVRRAGALVRPTLDLHHPAVRRIVRLLGPVALGQSASHVNTILNTIIGSFLAGGSVSYLYYADRLVEFPLGIFGVAVATAVLPTLSEQAARDDRPALRDTLSFALRLAAFVSAPAAVGLLILREPIVRVLYQRGQFGPVETEATALALGIFALALPGWTGAKIATQAFYALGDTRTPVKVATASMALDTTVALILARPLGHGGLAMAAAASGTAQAVALTILLRRRLGPGPPAARAAWLRIVAASAVLALVLVAGQRVWPAPADGLAAATWLALMIGGGIVVYGALHAALGSDEIGRLRQLVARRLRPARRR